MAAGPYVTANRFQSVSGTGIDTSFLTTPQVRGNLQRATAMVNAFTAQAVIPGAFDFRGGTVVDEQWHFQPPNPLIAYAGSRRVFPNQRPLRSVTAFALDFTSTYKITLDPAQDIYVNATEGWFEIVASQPTIIGYPPIGYWFGLYQPVATYTYTYGYRMAYTDDPLDAVDPRTWFGSVGSWDATGVSVTVNGATADPSTYAVLAADGAVRFTTAPAAQAEVAASYTSLIPPAVEQATAIVAADLVGKARNTARMPGLSSVKVAEITLTRMAGDRGRYTTRNGISIPEDAAVLLGQVNRGKAA